jgi:hypothetical protein
MIARIQGRKFIIELPVISPRTESKSGKSLLVATSHGTQQTSIIVDGKPVHFSATAFIHAELPPRIRFQSLLSELDKPKCSSAEKKSKRRKTFQSKGSSKR